MTRAHPDLKPLCKILTMNVKDVRDTRGACCEVTRSVSKALHQSGGAKRDAWCVEILFLKWLMGDIAHMNHDERVRALLAVADLPGRSSTLACSLVSLDPPCT